MDLASDILNQRFKDLHDSSGNKIDRANKPMELLTIKLDREIYPGDMIRACKSGLINLYQEEWPVINY